MITLRPSSSPTAEKSKPPTDGTGHLDGAQGGRGTGVGIGERGKQAQGFTYRSVFEPDLVRASKERERS